MTSDRVSRRTKTATADGGGTTLTIGKGVEMRFNYCSHALPDSQNVPLSPLLRRSFVTSPSVTRVSGLP